MCIYIYIYKAIEMKFNELIKKVNIKMKIL